MKFPTPLNAIRTKLSCMYTFGTHAEAAEFYRTFDARAGWVAEWPGSGPCERVDGLLKGCCVRLRPAQ